MIWSILTSSNFKLKEFWYLLSSLSPDLGKNWDGGTFNFWISGQSLIKGNCHKSRTSDDIDMKLEPVTKLDKKSNIKINWRWRHFGKLWRHLLFFQFTTNLVQSGSRIPDAQSVKIIFSLIVAFYLRKTENRTKKSLT